MEFTQMVYDNLTILDSNNLPTPQLATSWQAEKSGQEWVMTLREGVRFHGGEEFTAADVAATIERTLDKAAAGVSYNVFGPVRAVQTEGKYKVRVVMNAPFGEFPVLCAYRNCRIMPASGLDTVKDKPNGTGPFIFKDFQPGSSIAVERNPDYWDRDNVRLDAVRMVFIRESVAMQAALRGGQVDLITQIPVETYLAMKAANGFRAYSAVTGDHHVLYVMGNMAPFDNPKVRQAFRYLIDRKSLVASALFAQGAVGNDVTVPPTSFYLPELPQYEQDLPRAKKLLEEAGVGPITLDLFTTSERQPAPKMAIACAEAAAKVGITINVRDIPYTEYAANVARKKPMYNSFFAGSATLYDGVYRVYHSKGSYNYSGIETGAGTDAVLDSMLAEVDTAKRREIAFEAMRRIHDNSDRIIPYFRNYIGVTSDKVQGFTPPRFGTIETRTIWLSA
jgi:peptide/nickel transport system substrate-binding protein